MQIPQFERKHDAEKSDDEESKGNHVDHVQCTYCRLPQYDESTDDGEDTEGHIPAPVTGAVTFEVDGIAGRGKAPKHKPEGDDKRNHFHADHRIGNQVNTQNEVDESSYDIPSPARDTFPVAKSKDDFQNTAYQHRYTENDT